MLKTGFALSFLGVSFALSPCEHAARPFPAFEVHRQDRESKCNVGVIIGRSVGYHGRGYRCLFTLAYLGLIYSRKHEASSVDWTHQPAIMIFEISAGQPVNYVKTTASRSDGIGIYNGWTLTPPTSLSCRLYY